MKEIKQLKPFYDALKLRLVKGVKCAIQRRGKRRHDHGLGCAATAPCASRWRERA